MVKINGRKVEIYELDTIDSIFIRIATALETIPKYLYFRSGIPDIKIFYTENNIEVEDILNDIKENDSLEFNNFFEKIKPKLQFGINLYEDIFIPFIIYNKSLIDIDKSYIGGMILYINEDIKKNDYFPNIRVDIKKIWDERNITISHINNFIRLNKDNNKEIIDQNKILQEKIPIPFTEFELERLRFSFFLNIENTSIIEIFNLIHLTNRIPFASINGFYKVLKDNIPSKDWGISLENDIVIKMCQSLILPLNNDYETYMDVIISINNGITVVELQLDTSKQNISKDIFIEEFLSIFPTIQNIEATNIQEKSLKGSFYFPKITLNNYILADLVMNDKLFSSMMSIDDHEKATKKKNSVYIHFNNNKIGDISANITEKISEKGDPLLRGKDVKDLFTYNSHYVRVKISNAKNQNTVFMFQEILGKFLSIYNDKYNDIFKIYKKFIPNFGVKKNVETKDIPKLKLSDIAPEVFLPNYTKKCNDKPSIISDEEAEEAVNNGKKVMRYPISEEEGFIPRNYICNHDNAPYPGLRENPLENKDLVPYLPCCFKRDHSEIEGNIYAHYFKGEELKNLDKKQQQNFISTNKITHFNWYGLLPENITKMFKLFDDREDYSFVRKGVSNQKSSFLECVLEALDEKGILNINDEKERAVFLEKERKELSKKSVLCKQEMYDFTIEEINNLIKDPEFYLDPQYFINLIETTYNCNIYVFNRKNMNINAQLSLPRFLEGYYKTKKTGKCIFIYQHMGSQSDHLKEPRCELIIRWKETKSDDTEYSFSQTSNVYKGVNEIFSKMRLSYSLTTEIKETIFPLDLSKIKITEQGIDSYGKTRMLRLNFNNNIITLLTSPIQPIDYPEINEWNVTKVSSDIAIELCRQLGVKITGQDIIDDFAKTYNGKLGNVDISIPIENTIPTMTLENYKYGINYPEYNVSELNNYNKYKKLSRYITSYMFWLYSKYLNEENKSISLDSMSSFVKKYISVKEDFDYNGNINKKFDMKSPVMNDNKLVVKSEETLKRLLYTLRLFSRQRRKLLNYYTMENIENYYLDITDFDQYQFQVIIQTEEALENWINEHTLNYNLVDSIQTENIKPYFFKNILVSDDIWLAQNTDNIQKALKIDYAWKTNGYNIGWNAEIEENPKNKFLLFSYKNPKDIINYEIGGTHIKTDPVIVGYKINEKSLYTVLLPL